MKKLMIPVVAGLGLVCAFTTLNQEYSENINKEFTLQKDGSESTMVIYNVFGFIKVEGYEGDKVICTVKKSISGDNSVEVEQGKSEVKLDFVQTEDSIIAYISEPFDSRPRKNNDWDRDREIKYDFKLDFTVKVPFDMNLDVSTVLTGDITVDQVGGNLDINHVNGAIVLKEVKGITSANTVNGDIDVSYAANPGGESSYQTINGDINVFFQPGLSADMEFKSMTGEFYTDFPNVSMLPAKVKKSKTEREHGTVYEIDKASSIRIGQGGQLFKFETLNGNVYIKKQS